MVRQGALTVILNVKRESGAALEALLEHIGTDVEKNDTLQFRQSNLTHFARLVLMDGRSRLLFTSNYDGPEGAYLNQLRDALGDGLEKVFAHCEGCPDHGQFAAQFCNYIREHSYPTQTFYVAFPGRSVKEIAAGARARQWLDGLFDKASQWLESPSRKAWLVAGDPRSEFGQTSEDPLRVGWAESLINLVVGIRQITTQPENRRVNPDLIKVEDRVVQNQMTVIVNVKNSLWSRLLLRIVLWAANLQVKSSQGSLSNISTIHFARWLLIDNGTKLVFESNYDGSWERYIDDFVDRASAGLNAIWGNTKEYPLGGARDIEMLKESIRANQVPAQVFYSAYPQSTVVNIMNDLNCGQLVEAKFPADLRPVAAGVRVFPT